jgi:predicted metal-binding protein
MVKIGIIRCQEMSRECVGSGCFAAVKDKTDCFNEYYEAVELVGFDTCGGCNFHLGKKGADEIVRRALHLKKNGAEAIHLGTCMVRHCPNREIYLAALQEKIGLPIIEKTALCRESPSKKS